MIANLPKTVVVAMLERLHAWFGFAGIQRTLDPTPGPELAPEHEAETEVMPFPVLDACLQTYTGEKLAPDEVAMVLQTLFAGVAAERLQERAGRFVALCTLFRWVQTLVAVHPGSVDQDRERALQLPVIQQRQWSAAAAALPQPPPVAAAPERARA